MGVESVEKVFDKKFIAIENGQTFFHFKTGLSEFEFESRFIDVAELLLNQSLISIKNQNFRIIELEFYVFAEGLPDLYTHAHPDQKEYGLWHFHRAGKSPLNAPKGGNYKGVDLTLGNSTDYIGVLIRGVESENGVSTSGPSKFVDIIHQLHEVDSTKGFFQGAELFLKLKSANDLPKRKLLTRTRQGLFVKKGHSESDCKYWIDKQYRFYTKESKL